MNREEALSVVQEQPTSIRARVQLALLWHTENPDLAEELWVTAVRLSARKGQFFHALSLCRMHLSKERQALVLLELAQIFGAERNIPKQEDSGPQLIATDSLNEEEKKTLHIGTSLADVPFVSTPDIPIFSALSTAEFLALASSLEELRFRPGRELIIQGDNAHELYLVVEGKVRVHQQQPDGREITLADVSGPALLGEISLLSNLPRRASVTAISAGMAWRLSAEIFRVLQDRNPELIAQIRKTVKSHLYQNLQHKSPLFVHLTERELLFEKLQLVEFQPGEQVFAQGERSPGLYVILHGLAEVWMEEGNKVERIAQIAEGDTFGEQSLLLEESTSASVRMPEGGLLLHLSPDDFRSLRVALPGVEQELQEIIQIRKARDLERQTVQALLHPVALPLEDLLEEIVPYARQGFFTEVKQQPFFFPALFTVLTGLVLFLLLEGSIHTNNPIFTYSYEIVLAGYLGGIALFSVQSLLRSPLPVWALLASMGWTSLLFVWDLPLAIFALLFRPELVRGLAQSSNFFASLTGHFVYSGLMEELFKILPVLIALPVLSRFQSRLTSSAWRVEQRQRILMLLATSSAIGFTLMETLLHYVPRMHAGEELSKGMMLLIPRMITSVCGHVAWSGLFAYFIALAWHYKTGKVRLFVIGWIWAAALHGLWNACEAAGLPLAGLFVALVSFALFVAYLFRARTTPHLQ